MTNRTEQVVSSIVEGVRDALKKNDVTFDEFRAGLGFLMNTAEAGELPLMIDMFFNRTIVEVENKHSSGSASDLEGPYFLENAPKVNGRIKVIDDLKGEPMIVRGKVTDVDGAPVENVDLDVWASTPDGRYSGFDKNIPAEYYRGKLFTDKNGAYRVETTTPVPYQIPHEGPTGELLTMMGRHSWRPAHIHYKLRKPGCASLISQAYMEGGDWVGDDCCEGNLTNEFVMPNIFEDDKRVMEVNFVIDKIA